MPLIQQNFSMTAGDDVIVSLDIDPDVVSMIGNGLIATPTAYERICPIACPIRRSSHSRMGGTDRGEGGPEPPI